MDREDIRNLIIEATRRTDKASLMNSAINIAVAEVSKQRLWLDLMTETDLVLTASVAFVALPADVARVAEARLIISGSPLLSRRLLVRPKTWVVEHFPGFKDQSPGKPVYGYIEAENLFLAPIPDDDYSIRITYFKLHPDLTADTDELLIKHAGPAVAAYSTFWTFNSIEKFEEAKAWFETYATLLRSAMKVDTDNAVIQMAATGRDEYFGPVAEYWNDPFVKRVP